MSTERRVVVTMQQVTRLWLMGGLVLDRERTEGMELGEKIEHQRLCDEALVALRDAK